MRMLPIALSAVVALCLISGAGAAPKAAVGAKVTIREKWIGCSAPTDEERVKVLFAEQDRDALYRFFIDHMGPCAMLDPGTAGTVEQSGSGTVCLRPPGQIYCLWVPNAVLAR